MSSQSLPDVLRQLAVYLEDDLDGDRLAMPRLVQALELSAETSEDGVGDPTFAALLLDMMVAHTDAETACQEMGLLDD